VRLTEARLACVLLTRLPMGHIAHAPTLGATLWAFPLAGVLVGLAQGGFLAGGLALGLPAGMAAGLALAAGLWVTGGLHEDGLADLADGLSGGRSTARRLEIMRDSRIGSHGAVALIVALALRIAGWSALASGAALAALVALAMVSRAGMAVMLAALPQARREGLGAAVAEDARPVRALVAAALATVAAVALLGWTALAVLAAVAVAQAATAALAVRRLGGITGDVLGAAQVVGEVAGLTALLLAVG